MIDRFLKALSVYELSFVEFTPWEHNGNYGPFGLQNGGLAIPVNMIRSLYEDLIKLDKTDIILKGLLILNPSCYTWWNMRKRLVQNGLCAKQEYRFTSLVLSKHASVSIVWAHRYWLRSRIVDEMDDIQVCYAAASKYPRNYPCWVFRSRILDVGNENLLLEHWNQVRIFLRSNPFDFSAWTFKERLVSILGSLNLVDWDSEIAELKSFVSSYGERISFGQYEQLLLHYRSKAKPYSKMIPLPV